MPQVEAEFAQLNRDYDVQKKTYGDLLARREAATMGVDVQDTGGTQFRVIDPPRVAPQAVAPTRITMLGIAFALALAAGLLASFVASELMPTFHDARSLREIAQRPVLGMVAIAAQRIGAQETAPQRLRVRGRLERVDRGILGSRGVCPARGARRVRSQR